MHGVCNYVPDIICVLIFGLEACSTKGPQYHHWTPVQSETDAIVNYAVKCPPFSQSDGQPSATCLSYLWSSLGSWGNAHATILPNGRHHSTNRGCKSPICHTDEWLGSPVEALTGTVSCWHRGSSLFIATVLHVNKTQRTRQSIAAHRWLLTAVKLKAKKRSEIIITGCTLI